MTKRRWLALGAAALLSCARHEPAGLGPDGAHRVVSLAPSTTEALFAIGAGDRVVARSRYCDFPPQAMALPVVGDVEPDLEALLGLRPDLVVGLGGLTSERLVEHLRARGIATWFPQSTSLAAIDDLLLGLGQRTGRVPEAQAVKDAVDAHERAVERSVAGEPRPRVILMVSVTPLMAAGPGSFADELIAAAGASNVVTDGGAWPTLGFEQILDLDPDLVLDAAEGERPTVTLITPLTPGWAGLRAVRMGHVVRIRDERILRAGPRIAEGMAVLARELHPQANVP